MIPRPQYSGINITSNADSRALVLFIGGHGVSCRVTDGRTHTDFSSLACATKKEDRLQKRCVHRRRRNTPQKTPKLNNNKLSNEEGIISDLLLPHTCKHLFTDQFVKKCTEVNQKQFLTVNKQKLLPFSQSRIHTLVHDTSQSQKKRSTQPPGEQRANPKFTSNTKSIFVLTLCDLTLWN